MRDSYNAISESLIINERRSSFRQRKERQKQALDSIALDGFEDDPLRAERRALRTVALDNLLLSFRKLKSDSICAHGKLCASRDVLPKFRAELAVAADASNRRQRTARDEHRRAALMDGIFAQIAPSPASAHSIWVPDRELQILQHPYRGFCGACRVFDEGYQVPQS